MKRKMLAAALLTLCVSFLAGCGKEPVQPEQLLTEYIQLLNEEKYEEMYTYLSEDAKAQTDEETYVNRNRNIYGGIEASDIVIDISEDGDEEKDADTRRVKYTVTMQTLAGELSFDNMVAIFNKDEEGSYKMEWDSQDIFPTLQNSDTVRVVTTAAKRGNIYDRNQVELAREGVASSVGLVPGKLPEDREAAFTQLASLLEISVEKIENALSAGWVRGRYLCSSADGCQGRHGPEGTASGDPRRHDHGYHGAVLSLRREGGPAYRLRAEYHGGRAGRAGRTGL